MAVTNSKKNRPGVIVNLYDRSATDITVEDTIIRPLFLQLFSSDKGPEDLRKIHGTDFFKMYGNNPSFKKHGQPLIQAAEIIKSGGELLCKRIVAEDATLANLVILAKVANEKVQKVDSNGKPLFIDKDTGKETTESNNGANERAMINTAKIKYDAVSIKGIKTIEEARIYAERLVKDNLEYGDEIDYDHVTKVGDALTDENPVGQVPDTDDPDVFNYIYPLWLISDIGRGVSSKRFNIVPDYTVSKNLSFQLYKMNFIGDVKSEDQYVWFNFNEDSIYLEKSRSLSEIGKDFDQIKALSLEDSVDLFVKRVADITGIDEDELRTLDPIFGKNRKGESLQQITIDPEGYDLSSDLGMMLQEGENGSFGDKPFTSAAYGEQIVKVLDGTFDDSIYDVDDVMIDACLDANYPIEVKEAIRKLADFRGDFMYFRDFGTGLTSYDNIMWVRDELERSKFCADYCQSMDVIDPWSKKQITVTMTYLLSKKIVNHISNYRHCPLCGILYGMTFPEVVDGTVSYLPKVTPNVDQKELLCDNSINYASMLNDVLVLETEYTSQDLTRTQLGYINNVLAITQVIHDIREECPRIRYSFITNKDLDKYRDDINAVIKRRSTNFKNIYMDYIQDDIMVANKIFEADLYVTFNDFEQQEIFNIYTLSAEN